MVVLRAGTFGERVRVEREKKGWSQERLAQEAGVSQTTIDKIERGATKRSRFAPEIAKALAISTERLTGSNFDIDVTQELIEGFASFRRDGSRYAPLLVAAEDRTGLLVFGSEKIDDIEIPDEIVNKDDTIALQLASSSMSPEFEPGDVIFLEGGLKPVLGMAYVFTDGNLPAKRAMLGRLAYFDDESWTIQRWRGRAIADTPSEGVPRADFSQIFRVSARHMRR